MVSSEIGGRERYLFPAAKEELVRINAVGDGTADDRDPVKHHWRLSRVLQDQLLQDIDNHGENEGADESSADEETN